MNNNLSMTTSLVYYLRFKKTEIIGDQTHKEFWPIRCPPHLKPLVVPGGYTAHLSSTDSTIYVHRGIIVFRNLSYKIILMPPSHTRIFLTSPYG